METEVVVWPVGKGFLFFDWIYLLLAWASGLHCLLIDRLQTERRRTLAFARRLLIAGTLLMAGNASWRMYELGDLPISLPALVGQSLIFLGVLLLARGKLGIKGARMWPPHQPPQPRTPRQPR